MQEASEAWKRAHEQTLLPETFVEIEMLISSEEHNIMVVSSEPHKASTGKSIREVYASNGIPNPVYYATLEENLWILDGTRKIVPDDTDAIEKVGFVGYDYEGSDVSFDLVNSSNLPAGSPGLTITWSSEYGEYPTDFDLLIRRDNEVLHYLTVSGNKSNVFVLDQEIPEYNHIQITVFGWNFPNHRIRIDQIFPGVVVKFNKNDITSFTHEQSGDLLSASLPKNSISFSVDNTDSRWDLNNPTGVGKYITERQRLNVRYGTDINGITEWIPGGAFYLSEWNIPSNGLEASFVADNVLQHLENIHKGEYFNTDFAEVLRAFFEIDTEIKTPPTILSDIHGSTDEWGFDKNLSVLENIQLVANEHMRLIWCDRNDVVNIMPLNKTICNYPMTLDFAYSYPEITLSKQLKSIVVKGYDSTDQENQSVKEYRVMSVGSKGEDQVIDNPRLYGWPLDEEKSWALWTYAGWVESVLKNRKKVTGEFRADPRLDLYDIVEVESKYGMITPVAITNIKYTYNGSFRGYYEGQVITM